MTALGPVSCSGSGVCVGRQGSAKVQSVRGLVIHIVLIDGTHGAGAMESAAGVLIKLFCVHTK